MNWILSTDTRTRPQVCMYETASMYVQAKQRGCPLLWNVVQVDEYSSGGQPIPTRVTSLPLEQHLFSLTYNHQRKPRSLGLYSSSGDMSCCQISQNIEAARYSFKAIWSFLYLISASAAVLMINLSNFRTMQPFQHPISRLWDFTKFYTRRLTA